MNSHQTCRASQAVREDPAEQRRARASGAVRCSSAGEHARARAAAATTSGWPLPGRSAIERGLQPARAGERAASGERAARQRALKPASVVAASAGETLNQRTAPPLVCSTTKRRPPSVSDSPRLRHVAHLVRDQAADGVELLLGVVGASVTPKASSTRSIDVSPLTR